MTKKSNYFKERKKQNPKTAHTISLTRDIEKKIMALYEKQHDTNVSRVISDSVHFAYENGMYDNMWAIPKQETRGRIPSKEKNDERKQWAEEYGATVDAAENVTFYKYELAGNGKVVKNLRTTPLKTLPNDKEGVRKMMIGGFATLNEAEMRYKESSKTKPPRTIKAKEE